MFRAFLACAFCALSLQAQSGQLDASKSLFTVMAALNAAGYDIDAQSPTNHPLRAAITKRLTEKKLTTVSEVKDFLVARKQVGAQLELSRFISFAVSVDGPPNFNYKFQPHEMPPAVVPLEGFERLMSRFYKEADIEKLWEEAQPEIDKVLERYQESFIKTISGANAYLKNPTSGYVGRRFQIYVELLAPPNQIHTPSIKDDYYLVLTPSSDLQLDYLRYSYLHYLLDPLSFKFAEHLEKKKPLIDLAQAAPALEDHYKNDFQLLTTTCLIKAIEARMNKADGPAQANQALREGFILVPYFYEALAAYEKQEVAMRLYYPDLIDGINVKEEDQRLANVEFLASRPVKTVKVAPTVKKVELTGVFKTLADAEDLYRGKKFDQAKPLFSRALTESDERLLHAKAYFGLARIAAAERNAEESYRIFEKVLELEPDAATKAWSHVYLGLLENMAGETDKAVEQFKTALAVPGLTAGAKQAAENGLKDTEKKKEK